MKRIRFAFGLEPGNRTAGEFADYIRAETEKWGRIIKEAGITAK